MTNGLRVGITHKKVDLDSGSCLYFLQSIGEVHEIDFGVEKAEEYKGKAGKIYFVDTYPHQLPKGIEVEIYSQHFLEKILDEQELKTMQISSFELLTAAKGIARFDQEKMERWEKLVRYGDFKKDTGEMDVKRALSYINNFLELTDRDVYERWFAPLMESFLWKDKNIERGQRIFGETVSDFLLKNPDSPLRDTLNNWREKIKEPEKLDALRNIFHFLCYMDEDVGREWLLKIFRASELSQQDFLASISAEELIRSIKVDFGGNYVIVSQVTEIKNFPQALRYLIRRRSSLVPKEVIEKTLDEKKPYLLILVNPKTLNFYISSGILWEQRDWSSFGKLIWKVQEIFSELIKAIRAEILLRKGREMEDWSSEVLYERKEEAGYLLKLSNILRTKNPRLSDIVKREALKRMGENMKNMPKPWVLLSQPCDIAGTKPLFFNKKEFPQILWGSATHLAPPADIFGKTGEEIRKELVEIARLSIDSDYFPSYCQPKNCFGCPMELWYLKKCLLKKKGVC